MNVKHQLAEVALERSTRYATIFVKHLPDPEDLDEYTLLGNYSFSLQETRRRLISHSIELVDGIRETPAAISRDYIKLVYHHGPRYTSKQMQVVAAMPPEPNVAMPGRYLHGLYVDIEACYWNIMRIVGWDVDYNPGLWLSTGTPPTSYPFPENKVGRNCLVSAGMMDGIPYYNPHHLPKDPFGKIQGGSPIKNYQLPRLIHDVLNSIGSQCLDAGAIYANKDGFICPTLQSAENCMEIIHDWGLSTRIKAEGQGEVKASGTYQVGTARTMNFDRVYKPVPNKTIWKPPYAKWLQKRFSLFAADAK